MHIKTAGTTWLEELVGLAESGDEGVKCVRYLYCRALEQIDALTGPYASVIAIRSDGLPTADQVAQWDSQRWANTIRHIPDHPEFNPNVRQLLHVSFKLAAKLGRGYLDLLEKNSEVIARNVYENLYDRHMRPLFLG